MVWLFWGPVGGSLPGGVEFPMLFLSMDTWLELPIGTIATLARTLVFHSFAKGLGTRWVLSDDERAALAACTRSGCESGTREGLGSTSRVLFGLA